MQRGLRAASRPGRCSQARERAGEVLGVWGADLRSVSFSARLPEQQGCVGGPALLGSLCSGLTLGEAGRAWETPRMSA